MNLKLLDEPIIFAIVMTLIVLSVAHLLHYGANAAGWSSVANFFSLSPNVAGNQ